MWEKAARRSDLPRRVRTALGVVIGFNVAFALVDVASASDAATTLFAAKLALIAFLGGLWGAARPGVRPRTLANLVLAGTSAALGVSAYTGVVSGDPYTTPILTAVAVLACAAYLPWSVSHQAAVAVVGLASTAVVGVSLDALMLYPLFAVALAAALSCYMTFEMHSRLSAQLRGERMALRESALTASLARAGRDLLESLNSPDDLPARLCETAVRTLGCEFAHLLTYDSRRRSLHHVAGFGDSPERWTRLARTDLPVDASPDAYSALAAGHTVEIHAGTTDWLAFATRMIGVRSCLTRALRSDAEPMVFLSVGYTSTDKPFNAMQRRGFESLADLAALSVDLWLKSESLRESQVVNSYFAATMSHELRNTFGAIHGFSEMLGASAEALDADAVQLLEGIRRQVGEGLDIITAALELSRAQASPSAAPDAEIDVAAVIASVVGELASRPRAPGCEMETDVAGSLPRLNGDGLRLRMILKNLVSNALKFTREGTVRIAATSANGMVEIRVEDTGIGIPADALGQLFEPFKQVHGETSRQAGGAGLGLYIVKRLIDLWPGEISVASEPGRGTVFTVRLPIQSAASQETAEETK